MDDLSPADWQHTMHFPGTMLRANSSVALHLAVMAELQTLSVFAFKRVQNLARNLTYEQGYRNLLAVILASDIKESNDNKLKRLMLWKINRRLFKIYRLHISCRDPTG